MGQAYSNKAALMTAVKKIEIRDFPMPEYGADDVLVRPEFIGVCGSDAHFFESGERKGKKFDLPFILGHECGGVVVDTGKNVTHVRPGDKVCFDPQVTCGKCEYCRTGRYNMCPDVIFPSVPPYNGMLQTYISMPAKTAYRLPENVSTLEGALIEPLAVGLSAAKRGDVTLGDTVLILGSGCNGIVTIMACLSRGATKVIVSDLYENRLQKAKELGASAVIDASKEDTKERVMELTDGKGADIVFETAGSQATASRTIDYLKRGGVIVMVGNVNGETPIRLMDLMYQGGEIRTIYRYVNNFPTAIEAVSSGRINIKGIVSHRFGFEDTQQAFENALYHRSEVIKSVIEF